MNYGLRPHIPIDRFEIFCRRTRPSRRPRLRSRWQSLGCVHDAGGNGVEPDTFFCDWLIYKRRNDTHNISRFLFQHLFHGELSDVKESQQVGRDQRIEVLGSTVREGIGAEDSGVIHQNIDSSEVLDRRFDSVGSGLRFTNIAIDENQAR